MPGKEKGGNQNTSKRKKVPGLVSLFQNKCVNFILVYKEKYEGEPAQGPIFCNA